MALIDRSTVNFDRPISSPQIHELMAFLQEGLKAKKVTYVVEEKRVVPSASNIPILGEVPRGLTSIALSGRIYPAAGQWTEASPVLDFVGAEEGRADPRTIERIIFRLDLGYDEKDYLPADLRIMDETQKIVRAYFDKTTS